LVHAAAGGVGQLLVQWLKHLGAIVIGTASNEEKLSTVRALGADHTVNYSNGFLDAVMDLTHGRGVDLALDDLGRPVRGLNLVEGLNDTTEAAGPQLAIALHPHSHKSESLPLKSN
jgi:NADPH:quinone reductase-like Zn-dependent oxidoreductase